MELKITDRDKTLLSILACVLIAVGFIWYLIIPAVEKSETLDSQLEETTQLEQEMEMSIASYPTTQKNYESASAGAKEATNSYYDLMTAQEVDRELTSIVVSNGLECTDLNIDPLAFADVEPYVRSSLARGEEISGAVEAAGGTSTENASSETASSESEAIEEVEAAASDDTSEEGGETAAQEEIYVYKAALTVQGTEENYQRIIDQFVNNYPAIRLTGLSYEESKKQTVLNEDGTLEETETGRTLTLNLELYMCDKATMEDGE